MTFVRLSVIAPPEAALPFPVNYQKLSWQQGLRIASGGLTQVPIFVE